MGEHIYQIASEVGTFEGRPVYRDFMGEFYWDEINGKRIRMRPDGNVQYKEVETLCRNCNGRHATESCRMRGGTNHD